MAGGLHGGSQRSLGFGGWVVDGGGVRRGAPDPVAVGGRKVERAVCGVGRFVSAVGLLRRSVGEVAEH